MVTTADAFILGSFIDAAGFIIGVLVLLVIVKMIFEGSRSQKHRKLLTNLYVAGRIRQIADEKNIDLKEELAELLQSIKDQKKYSSSLDETIELELKDEIMDKFKEDKKKKSKVKGKAD